MLAVALLLRGAAVPLPLTAAAATAVPMLPAREQSGPDRDLLLVLSKSISARTA